jgi:hypothetical protein
MTGIALGWIGATIALASVVRKHRRGAISHVVGIDKFPHTPFVCVLDGREVHSATKDGIQK